MRSFTVGLDLGQTHDYSAWAVIERSDAGSLPSYVVRDLGRVERGTPYTSADPKAPGVAERVKELLLRPLRDGSQPLVDCRLAVDQTGVGRAVVDVLRRLELPAALTPITITGGHDVTVEGDGFHVPKKDLIACVQVLLSSGRLVFARHPERAVLENELKKYQVRITIAANETFGAWREGQHDDLVLAVALACWLAERCPPFEMGLPPEGRRNVADSAPRGVFID